MGEDVPVAPPQQPRDQPAGQPDKRQEVRSLNYVSIAGLSLLYVGTLLFAAVAFILLYPLSAGKTSFSPAPQYYIPEYILGTAGIFLCILGVGLVRAAGFSSRIPTSVVSPNEWSVLSEQLKAGNDEPITQYIRLTSLTGITGLFTKLGIIGLPLATIALTIFFTLLYAFDGREFLDLAKLTLGAFIGSFVQKQVSGASSGGSVRLPSGETVKLTPNPATPT